MPAPRIGLIGVVALLLQGPALAYLTDGEVHPPPDYPTFLPPGAGEAYADPVFGTRIVRLTEAPGIPDAADAGNLTFVIQEYSNVTPFNSRGTRLLLQHGGYFALYDGRGRYLRDLPLEIGALSEPRWSRLNPHLIYYLSGNQLLTYDTASGERSIVRTFGEYARVSGLGESDLSLDGDHLALVGDRRDVFVYRISTGTKGPLLDTTGLGGFDLVHITPRNNVLVGWYAIGSGRYQGMELYDRDMRFLRQASRATGHLDTMLDPDGEEVLLVANAADPQPVCANGVVKVRLSDASQTCLVTFDWSLALHVSAPDDAGWFYVSTYAPSDPLPGQGWTVFTNEILRVSIDGSEIRRMVHHRSRPFNPYNWTPRVSVSRDGHRIVFSSNYGLQSLLGLPAEYSDVYLFSTRVEEHHDQVIRASCPWYLHGSAVHSGGRAALAMEPGAEASFRFTGSEVRWIGYADEWSGLANVYLDGLHAATVDTYAAPPQPQAVLFSLSGLPWGGHTLVVEASGARHPQSSGAWVWIDAFEIASPDGGRLRHEEDDPAVRDHDCVWYTDESPLHSGGSAALAMLAGAQIVFRFDGTAARWIGFRDPWSGLAHVYLDGVVQAEIDTYAAAHRAQSTLYAVEGLPAGPHALLVQAAGRRNERSGGTWVWVDAFEADP